MPEGFQRVLGDHLTEQERAELPQYDLEAIRRAFPGVHAVTISQVVSLGPDGKAHEVKAWAAQLTVPLGARLPGTTEELIAKMRGEQG